MKRTRNQMFFIDKAPKTHVLLYRHELENKKFITASHNLKEIIVTTMENHNYNYMKAMYNQQKYENNQ